MAEFAAAHLSKIEEQLTSQEMFAHVRTLGELQRPFTDVLRDSLGEARHFMRQLSLEQFAGKKVLEVGAGLGIVSACLEKIGVSVEAVEPAISGFDDHARLLPLIRRALNSEYILHSCSVDEISHKKNGQYDLIFSHNVLEHMADLKKSFHAMARMLKPGGRMVHSCPNYFVPYEPHYGVWLFPFFPQATPLFSGRIRKSQELWRSLNFITARRMRCLAAVSGCSVRFEKGSMHEALVRIESDPVFAARQSGWPCFFRRILKKSALLSCVRSFPPQWATPMIVHLEKTAP